MGRFKTAHKRLPAAKSQIHWRIFTFGRMSRRRRDNLSEILMRVKGITKIEFVKNGVKVFYTKALQFAQLEAHVEKALLAL